MKNSLSFFLLVISYFCFSQNQRINDMSFYYGFSDYQKNSSAKPNVYAEIKNQNDSYIKVSSFRFSKSDKKAKMEDKAWLMSYNDNLYFNMNYASHIYCDNTFAKVNITGKKYLLIYLDEEKDKKAIGNNNPYGYSVVGMAINADLKSKANWKDKKGKSYKILLVPIGEKNNPFDKRDLSFGLILETKIILNMTNNDQEVISKLKNNQYYLEDVIKLINRENNTVN